MMCNGSQKTYLKCLCGGIGIRGGLRHRLLQVRILSEVQNSHVAKLVYALVKTYMNIQE